MGKRAFDPLNGEIHIHTSQKERGSENISIEKYLDEWRRSLDKLTEKLRREGHDKREGMPRHSFHVTVWGPGANNRGLHDRFLLTDQCGIKVGRFDCLDEETTTTTTWTLLDQATWNERRNDHVRDIGPYQWLGERPLR